MIARIAIVATLVVALVAGVALFWLQEYAFYEELAGEAVTLTRADGTTEAVAVPDLRAIDSASSPIRYRACFTLPAAEAARLEPYPAAEPRHGPRWFDCFDAGALGAALEAGEATAVLGQRGVHEGVDRVVAVFPDGRAFAWHQPDPCGALVDEDERPASCIQGS